MSSHRLMCIWEAYAASNKSEEKITRDNLKSLLQKITRKTFLKFNGDTFDNHFKSDDDVNIDNLSIFLQECVTDKSVPFSFIVDDIEDECWKIVKDTYQVKLVKTVKFPIKKIWKVFISMGEVDLYPPQLRKSDLDKLKAHHLDFLPYFRRFWKKEVTRFGDFLILINEMSQSSSVENVVVFLEKLYNLLVEKIYKAGWLYVRSNRNGNWSDWTLRWVTVSHGKLCSFETRESNMPKGKVVITCDTVTKAQPDQEEKKILQVTIDAMYEIELYTLSDNERNEWVEELQKLIDIEPKRNKLTVDATYDRRGSVELTMSEITNLEDIEMNKKHMARIIPSLHDDMDELENIDPADTERILSIFLKSDTNGNGLVSKDEFANFLNMLAEIDQITSDHVFGILDTDHSGSVSFDEFYRYFLGKVLTTDETDGNDMMALTVEDHEDEKESGDSEKTSEKKESNDPLENHLKKLFQETDTNSLAEYLRTRWKSFTNFERAGQSGDIVMTGSKSDVIDILPGTYFLADIAGVKMHGGKIEPRRAIFKNAVWEANDDPSTPGRLLLPTNYDGSIPIDIGTRENLRYYGCHIADDNQFQVTLALRHVVQDFTYTQAYVEDYVETINGAGLEKHGFDHIDCPLVDNSGYFVIGKMVQNGNTAELHVTSFIIPTNHTVYVPAGTIHSNDYQKGTWRTMLSDETHIETVKLRKPKSRENKEETVPVAFKMTGWWAGCAEKNVQ